MSKAKAGQRPVRARGAPVPTGPRPAGATPAEVTERQAARQARQQQARVAARRQRQRRVLRTGGLAAAVLLLVGGLLLWALLKDANLPGQGVGQQPSPHVPTLTTAHAAYTTDPPTSGPHVAQVPAWGASTIALAKELQVHALEDGGVIVSYQPSLDAATVTQLSALVSAYSSKVILAPYPGLSQPIVATAWTRLQPFAQYDEASLRRFIDAFRGVDHHQQSGS